MSDEIELWKRKAERERRAREEAEAQLEFRARELFLANEQLRAWSDSLEVAVQEATRQVRLFEHAYEHAIQPQFLLEPDGTIRSANQAALTWLGHSREEVLGRPVHSFDAVEGEATWLAHFRALEERGRLSVSGEHTRRDGQTSYIEIQTTLLPFEGERLVFASVQDVTRREQYLRDLRESEARARKLSSVAARTDNAVVITDPKGRVEWVNEGFERLTGYSLDAVLGRSPGEVLQGPDTDPETVRDMGRKLRAGQGFRCEVLNYRRDDSSYWVQIEVQPVHDESGTLIHFVAVESDITAAREMQEMLERARRDAERASRAKSEFLANISHEIRTPLAAILGYVDLLAGHQPAPFDRGELAHRTRRHAEYLISLVDDVLDLSRIEAGELRLVPEWTVLRDVWEDVQSLFEARAEERGLELLLELGSGVPHALHIDAVRLRQVLVNLVGNAIKFTEHGQVRLVVRGGLVPGGLRLEVHDTGPGIASERLGELFRPFARLRTGAAGGPKGTGLGLALSRRLVQAMGGEIGVTSEPGRGSVFWVELRHATDQIRHTVQEHQLGESSRPRAESRSVDLRGRKVLVAEDSEDNRLLVRMWLEAAGVRVETVEDGREALLAIQRANDDHDPFDAILMDVQMPEMDGLEATAVLRDLGVRTPIVAFTAHVLRQDAEACLRAGCDAHLTKPVRPERLLETLARLVQGGTGARSGAGRREPGMPAVRLAQELVQTGGAQDPAQDDARWVLLRARFVEHLIGLRGLLADPHLGREELRRQAHLLAGTGGGYGFPALTTRARALEQELRSGGPIESARSGLLGEIDRVIASCPASESGP